MTKPTIVRELVINGYLDGKSYDQIAYELDIAKGSVFNIINTWIAQIGIPDIDALREFSVTVRKSGITIKQCAQSYRFIQILASFGISDELDSTFFQNTDLIQRNTAENEDRSVINKGRSGGMKKDHAITPRNNFDYFIEDIYNNCNRLGIKSTNVIQWIQDLLEFNSSGFDSTVETVTNTHNDIIEPIEYQNLTANKMPLTRKPEKMNERDSQIPFISHISGFIKQKKIKVQGLDIYKNKLQQEIRNLEGQKNILVSKINTLKRKESASLTYLDWYNNLKNEILNEYGIKLEEEFSSFVRVFSDFKYYDYDAHQIVKEYKQIESLRYEMKSIQGIIESIIVTRDDLLGTIESLETEKSYSRLSLNALQELTYAGFGVEELKLLKNIIIEISLSNGISVSDAGKKFLKDVESQYDSKLGFESKITELQTELKKLEDEVPGYKEYLQSRVFISGALQYLYKYHVTDDDIINMTDIVTAYKDGNIILNSKLSTEDIVDENRLVKKKFYWKSLINEIINLGDINSQVAKQRSYLDLLKKETDDLNIGRQKLNEQILLSGQLLNSLSGQLTHFVESLKQIMSSAIELNQKIFILYQLYFFIHITISGSKGNNNKQKGE